MGEQGQIGNCERELESTHSHCPQSSNLRDAGKYRSQCLSLSQTHHGLRITDLEILWELQELCAPARWARTSVTMCASYACIWSPALTLQVWMWMLLRFCLLNVAKCLLGARSYETMWEDSPWKCRWNSAVTVHIHHWVPHCLFSLFSLTDLLPQPSLHLSIIHHVLLLSPTVFP